MDRAPLPIDAVAEILQRLPVDPLLRFKSVSKQWHSLISDPFFAQAHLARQVSDKPPGILLFDKHRHSLFFLDDADNPHPTAVKQLRPPLPHHHHQPSSDSDASSYKVLGCCRGLLLLYSNPDQNAILWNPSTGQTLKGINCPRPLAGDNCLSGLCFDPVADDYVAILAYHRTSAPPPAAFVLRFKLGAWRQVHFPFPFYGDGEAVLLKGIPHWVAKCQEYRTTADRRIHVWMWNSIVYFDVADDRFKILPKPNSHGLRQYWLVDFSLQVWREQLCATHLERADTTLEVWTMREYGVKESWARLFVIPAVRIRELDSVKPLYFKDNGELVMASARSLSGAHRVGMWAYNPEHGTSRTVMTFEELRWNNNASVAYRSLQAFPFTGSLIWMDAFNRDPSQPFISQESWNWKTHKAW